MVILRSKISISFEPNISYPMIFTWGRKYLAQVAIIGWSIRHESKGLGVQATLGWDIFFLTLSVKHTSCCLCVTNTLNVHSQTKTNLSLWSPQLTWLVESQHIFATSLFVLAPINPGTYGYVCDNNDYWSLTRIQVSHGYVIHYVCLQYIAYFYLPRFVNSLRPIDAYMRRQTNHNWFR